MVGNQTTTHSDRSIDSIWFWTTKFWLLKIFGWRHPRLPLVRYHSNSQLFIAGTSYCPVLPMLKCTLVKTRFYFPQAEIEIRHLTIINAGKESHLEETQWGSSFSMTNI